MKLFHFPPAPNAARVLFYIKEKGLSDIELVIVNFLNAEQSSPAHLARSPRGTVPVLELDDGTCLTESVAIIEYLEELYPEPPLIGTTSLQRQQTRATERYIELNVFQRLVRLVHATNSPIGIPANPALAENERRQLPSSLAYVDELVGDGPYVMRDRISIADCTLLAGMNFANFGQLTIVHDYANLMRWFDHFALRHLD